MKYLISLLSGAIALTVVGYQSLDGLTDKTQSLLAQANPTQPSNTVQTITLPPSKQLPAEVTIETSPPVAKGLSVQIFHPDRHCDTLISESATVSPQNSLEEAIGKTIKQGINGDFSLAGYRVNVNNGTATIDFRLAADSRRNFQSLSQCELFALFGSLRQTLTQNPQWNIKTVRFTEQGQEISL
ncbi:GerMN domain-containing protein [Spirulina sp. CS-785/01]|uniref:GerMN domain-containing protein n=1 Tax=Spirulina sp. CS-785/01 TaxID=3021716 RepID=UPI00232D8AC0|nr:GerMN domain-containing protein [Spirulina sp. CS-785/01]MDB9313087.1 GerMN domain-containing protein [Spirulina sp. CS-785/01]